MDDLDSKNLGRLRRVANPRDVWVSESGDFTPWLADNIDVLAEALGMSLVVVGTEIAVGGFRLDIHAQDDAGRTVIIENQLERTDHGHLGQCIVYASGLEAGTVVWVAPEFRDEFRRALDWLNERTDLGVNFFGVEVSVVQIGASGPRAPVFDVVARPNDWQKAVKQDNRGSNDSVVTTVNAQRQDFFAEVLSAVATRRPSFRLPARGRAGWLAFAAGPFGTWNIQVVADGRLRVEAYIDTGDVTANKALFDEFRGEADRWELAVGGPLSWERLDGRRASRIGMYHPVDLDDPASRDAALAWATETLTTMMTVLDEPLRSAGKRQRSSATDR